MNDLLLYLLKVSAGTALFYFCFILLFSKDTFYLRNRLFLILALFLPAVFPALKIPVISDAVTPPVPVTAIENTVFSGSAYEKTMAGTINPFDYSSLLIWIYFIITGLLVLRIVVSLISTYLIIKKGTVKYNRFPKVIISDDHHSPFSFFPYTVIPAEDYNSKNYTDILDHETAHVRQGHTFDLVLSELFAAFQWFNPFVWLIKRSVTLNHEYLADNFSLRNKNAKEYQYMLLNFQAGLKNISLVHSFNSLIKNRIIMINKKPTNKYATLKNCLILPVIAMAAYAFATPEYHYSASAGTGTILQAQAITAGPGSIQAQAISTGTATILQTQAKTAGPGTIQAQAITAGTGTILQTQAKTGNPVKGIVVNEEGTPVEGATVIISGTHSGVSTDASGRFTIGNVAENAHLIISSEGYVSKYLEPAFSTEMKVEMSLDKGNSRALLLRASFKNGPYPLIYIDGVESNKRINEIDKSEIKAMMILSAENAPKIYGEKGKNGVIMISTKKKDAEPVENTPPDTSINAVRIRSTGADLANTLIVIDGVVSKKKGAEGLKELDPTDILSVTVLKDQKSTDKYGEKGKDGVIEVTTRKNQPGNAQHVPVAVFAGKSNGSVSRDIIAKTDIIEVRSSDGALAPEYEIKRFTLLFSQDMEDFEELSKGNQLTDKMKSLISNLERGQIIYFKDIRAVGPDGKPLDLGAIILKIE